MLIIVESGSTKSDWVILNESKDRTYVKTMGFNPYFHDELIISSAIKNNEKLKGVSKKVKQIFFYGAGCSSPELQDIVKTGLSAVFTNADIQVNHDLDACAYATYDGRAAISCILGTGSNSCYFDGERVSEEVPALAYVLGDEGSGSYYGKILLSKFLYKQLPADLHDDFKAQYQLNKEKIMRNVYFRPHANVYIASFMRFMSKHKTHPFVQSTIRVGMRKFMETHVLCFENATDVPVHFVGSIAFYFEDILREVAASLDLQVGVITNKPIEGLIEYHLQSKVC